LFQTEGRKSLLKNKRIIAALLTFIFVSIMIKTNDIHAASTFKNLPPIQGVKANHEFKIRLSRELDETSLIDGAIKIYEKDTLKPVDIIARRDTYDAKLIRVKGKSDFEIGKTYTLEVKNLKSKKDEYFKQAYKVDFTVKSAYAGLPAEAGLIIVDNKAYAIDYLKKNVWMVNEILSQNYDVYYFYDVNYQKIRSLFNIGPVNSSNVNINREPITYIDKDGNRHLYVWREDREEYELAVPKAMVDVISRSDAKAVSINVSEVSSVPDAAYYSIKGSNLIKNFGDPLAYIAAENTEEISILSQDRSVIAKGVVSVNKNYSGEVVLTLVDSLNSGNSAGNINNNGIAAGYNDGYIYYVNNADKEKLYKQSIGGIYNRVISEDKAQYVNESGDWIYFSNYTDGGKLYKIKKDGTLKQKMLEDKAAYITISGQDIYYSNHSDGGKLYRVKKDLSDAKIGSDGLKRGNSVVVSYGNYNGDTDEVAYINVVGDWIYYTNYSDGHKPYVIHKEGSFRGKLSDSYADCLQVQGDWIYFTSDAGTISKISKSIGSSVIPIKATTSEFNKGHHINVYGDWIFYSNAEDAGKLYKINTDGSGNKIKLSDENVGYINVVGNWVYFTTVKGKLFRVPVSSNGDIAAEEITLNNDPNKVVEIQNIYVTVDYSEVDQPVSWLENKYLPQKVAATMADNTMQQLVVAWDTNPKSVTVKDGVRTYKGTVVGFNMTINLVMTIPSQMLNDTNKVTVYKNGNKNDIVIVEGISSNISRPRIAEGDVIIVADKLGKLLGSANVGRDGRAIVSKLDLNDYGDSIFVSVKRGAKAPSNPTEVRLYNVPVVKSADVMDSDLVGLGFDSRDIAVNRWAQAYFDTYKVNALNSYYTKNNQEIYVLPNKTALDMTKHNPLDTLQVKNGNVEITSWNGSVLGNSQDIYPNRDSLGAIFKGGAYDVYVSNTFSGKGSADLSGYRPAVEGKIANSIAATFTMIGEGIPAKPTIKAQRVQGSGLNQPNDSVVLDKPLQSNETAWLVPVSIIDKYNLRGWRAEMGANPFQALVGVEDVKSFSGSGTVMDAPTGEVGGNAQDTEYKLFIVNEIGASPESDNKIVVDNKKPDVTPISNPNTPGSFAYYVGEPINVTSSEKGRVYIVTERVAAAQSVEALDNALKVQNALMVTHSGSYIKVPMHKSETLVDFLLPGITIPPTTYYVVGVDEAGNLSVPVPISIQRDFNELDKILGPAVDFASSLNPAPADLLASIAKAQALLTKTGVKQSEIDVVTKDLQAKMGMVNSELTLSTNDTNIRFEGNTIKVYQMTVQQLRSKLITRQGIQPVVYKGTDIASGTDFTTDGMKVQVESGNEKLEYTLYVYAATNISTKAELLHAINENKNIDTITVAPGSIILDAPISITRKLSIQGSAAGNSEIRLEGGAMIENSGDLTLSKLNFTGTSRRVDSVIRNENSATLTINNSKFNSFNFDVDGLSVIDSMSGSRLVITGSTFSGIRSDGNTFSHIFISSDALPGTKIESSYFYGLQTGNNVKGIMIGGTVSNYNQILINKNTFNGFISDNHNNMSIPIYADGGWVSLSGNIITNSEAGIFLDVANRPVQVDTINVSNTIDNFAKAGALILSKNKGVTGNYFGDIMLGATRDGQVPVIYYNSTLTPIIKSITIGEVNGDLTKGTLTIDDVPLTGRKYMIKQSSMISTSIPPKVGALISGTDGYSDYSQAQEVTRGSYLTIVEVDANSKVTRYRQTYIP
jgi:small nuclear ribonucleoprotein (snRNP)-like protein